MFLINFWSPTHNLRAQLISTLTKITFAMLKLGTECGTYRNGLETLCKILITK